MGTSFLGIYCERAEIDHVFIYGSGQGIFVLLDMHKFEGKTMPSRYLKSILLSKSETYKVWSVVDIKELRLRDQTSSL